MNVVVLRMMGTEQPTAFTRNIVLIRVCFCRLFRRTVILAVLTCVTRAGELPTTATTNIVHWTNAESVLQLEQDVPFYPHRDSKTVIHSDGGFHHKILPGLVTYENQQQAEIRYEPDEVKPEADWEEVLNMQPAGDERLDSLPVFDVEWSAELHGACDCWNTSEDGRDVEVECRCGGEELTDIPSNLASDVHRM